MSPPRTDDEAFSNWLGSMQRLVLREPVHTVLDLRALRVRVRNGLGDLRE